MRPWLKRRAMLTTRRRLASTNASRAAAAARSARATRDRYARVVALVAENGGFSLAIRPGRSRRMRSSSPSTASRTLRSVSIEWSFGVTFATALSSLAWLRLARLAAHGRADLAQGAELGQRVVHQGLDQAEHVVERRGVAEDRVPDLDLERLELAGGAELLLRLHHVERGHVAEVLGQEAALVVVGRGAAADRRARRAVSVLLAHHGGKIRQVRELRILGRAANRLGRLGGTPESGVAPGDHRRTATTRMPDRLRRHPLGHDLGLL